jgi:photosystem II stability/assembly factor-like uncharacterized protein
MRFFSLLLLGSFAFGRDIARAQAEPQGQQGWVQENSGTTQQLANLSFPSADTAYVFAGGGIGALRSLDGGAFWQSLPTPELGFFGFWTAANGYVASYSGHKCYHTTDGGQNWSSSDDSCFLVSTVYPVTADTCFVMGDGYISRTTDAGKSWSPELLKINAGAIAFYDSKRGVAVGAVIQGPKPNENGAGCSITTDGGNYWAQQYSGAQGDFKGVVYLSPTTIVAVGVYDSISRSTDGGLTWKSYYVPFPPATQELSAICYKGKRIIVIGPAGYIATSIDSGLTWQQELSGITTDLGSLAMLDSSTALASGVGGMILKTTNGGADWVQVAPPSPIPLQTLAFPQPETALQEIEYSLPQLQHVTVRVYDLTGHVIETLLDKELQPAGQHRVTFRGDALPAGTYIYHIDTERYHASGKSVLVK